MVRATGTTKRKRPGPKKSPARTGSRRRKAPGKGKLREWFDALVFALLAALIIRTFFFEAFRIPTPSMEENLLVGDFLLVSKMQYGTRMPITLGVPFTDIYFGSFELPFFRLPGFGEVKHGDSFVFNYPPEDVPIDRKTHYIKRAMGLPGDELEVRNKVVHINGEPVPLDAGMQVEWLVEKSSAEVRLPGPRLRDLGVEQVVPLNDRKQVILRFATRAAADEIASWPYVVSIEPFVEPAGVRNGTGTFPQGASFSRDNYGPVLIPAAGLTVPLNDANWALYKDVITKFESQSAHRFGDGRFQIDGIEVTEYTFAQDYFFAMGDNRDNSLDSRFWGFVPEDHVVGKASLIYFSWDAEDRLPRFGRLFSLID